MVLGLLGGAWYLWPRFERTPPQIQVTPDSDVLGRTSIEIVVSDRGTGLKSVTDLDGSDEIDDISNDDSDDLDKALDRIFSESDGAESDFSLLEKLTVG